jgi:hypothetical protein
MRALSMAEDSTSKGLYSTCRNYYVNQSILSQVADLPGQFPRSLLGRSKVSSLMIQLPFALPILCFTFPGICSIIAADDSSGRLPQEFWANGADAPKLG